MTAGETQVHVFVGKGGVGKTTCAAATALALAERGLHTLALSTDPTPSLAHIFAERGSQRVQRISRYLSISELGLAEVREMWNAKFGREVYAVFSTFVDLQYPAFLEFMTALLPGLREEFMVDYIRELAENGTYERIVWDTAPLGQTLALLEMPTLLARHLRMAPRVYSRLRATEHRKSVLEIIESWSELAAACTSFLQERTRFSLVTIPEALAVEQIEPVLAELTRHGFGIERVIINNVVRGGDSQFLARKAATQAPYLRRLQERFADSAVVELPAFAEELRGLSALREVARVLYPTQKIESAAR